MASEMMLSTILISLALVFYTIGVWSERFAGRLKGWHLIFFWGGLIFDTVGTGMMMEMAGGLTFDIHGVTHQFPQIQRSSLGYLACSILHWLFCIDGVGINLA